MIRLHPDRNSIVENERYGRSELQNMHVDMVFLPPLS